MHSPDYERQPLSEQKPVQSQQYIPSRLNVPRAPLPEPLRGLEEGTFTHYTITQRFRQIAQRLLDEATWPTITRKKVLALIGEIPYHTLRPINDPCAPDHLAWEGYLRPYLGMNWLQAPWFLVETYFFRRLIEATGYYQHRNGYKQDPFPQQKRLALDQLSQGLRRFDLSKLFFEEPLLSPTRLSSHLAHLFHLAVWANQADLSMWPAGNRRRPAAPPLKQMSKQLLVDHARLAGDYLVSHIGCGVRVDVILDNVGLELAMDLIIADYLLRHGFASCVVFHLKPHPTYVSDATQEDVLTTIEALAQIAASSPEYVYFTPLRTRIEGYLRDARLLLTSHYYWTSPLSGWEMPEDLHASLAQSHLIISKGDANYRRWVGDRHWPFTTPLEEVLGYVPAPLLALRVLKAEVVVGLQPGQAEEMFARDAQWMYDGRWGIMQFFRAGK